MSSTAQVLETSSSDRARAIWFAVLSSLTILLYWHVLKALVLDWWGDPDYGHGFLVPLFSGYVLWRERERWARAESKPSNFGLLVMAGAVVLLIGGSLGAELFTSRVSFIVLLAGMIPIPVIIYNQITFPLQLIASRFATFWLEVAQVPVLREGNVLILPNYSLEVVEACSGIRSLMTLITLAVAYGYLVEPRRWVRYLLVILMIPIAIVSNAIRIMGTGVLTYHFGPKAAEGFFHEFSGWVIFLAALILMFASHSILKRFGNRQEQRSHA